MQRVKYTFYIILAVIFAFAQEITAQNRQVDSLVRLGESLHMQYRFEDACGAFEEAESLLAETDSIHVEAIAEKMLLWNWLTTASTKWKN